MGYRTLNACVQDLERHGKLIVCDDEVSPHLEIAEIQRRLYLAGGPAVLFRKASGCNFPLLSNLFGTIDRARFVFRDTLEKVQRLVSVKVDPSVALRSPLKHLWVPWFAWRMLPKRTRSRGGVLTHETTVSKLPQIVSWPQDGGPFVTLPTVYSENAEQPGMMRSNLGMYRIQLSGGDYESDREVGLHYQIHRGIGVHHEAARRMGKPFPVNVFVGGAPAMTFAGVMPLPEGMSELTIAGAMAGHRISLSTRGEHLPVYSDADFCIQGLVDPDQRKLEGPFGDHLGYYSLQHEFPVLRVTKVTHRPGAIWPLTVVGRPPQEDTVFGELIHEISGPVIPTVVPGVSAVHAVDATGVHPLLLAQGSERYTPYETNVEPQELLTQANAILGQGQMSLAKYVMIMNHADDPELDIHDVGAFMEHMLKRVRWERDLHFQTRTTIDTLDYSGHGLNQGSKLVIAAVGQPVRSLSNEIPSDWSPPLGFSRPVVCRPGILAIQAGQHESEQALPEVERLAQSCTGSGWQGWPLIVVVDDSEFTARTLNNFLWVVFTRSNPAVDVSGVESFTDQKHWGCRGPLIVDARIKAQHAPPLVEDPEVTKRVDALAAQGGVLARYL